MGAQIRPPHLPRPAYHPGIAEWLQPLGKRRPGGLPLRTHGHCELAARTGLYTDNHGVHLGAAVSESRSAVGHCE